MFISSRIISIPKCLVVNSTHSTHASLLDLISRLISTHATGTRSFSTFYTTYHDHPPLCHPFPFPSVFSDALSAPLCLIPARQGDASVLPLVLPAAADEYASVPDSLLRSVNGGDSGMGAAEDGGVIDEMGKSSIGEDIEWIRMAEDTDYLYVELLLARTLDELAEGLAFASR